MCTRKYVTLQQADCDKNCWIILLKGRYFLNMWFHDCFSSDILWSNFTVLAPTSFVMFLEALPSSHFFVSWQGIQKRFWLDFQKISLYLWTPAEKKDEQDLRIIGHSIGKFIIHALQMMNPFYFWLSMSFLFHNHQVTFETQVTKNFHISIVLFYCNDLWFPQDKSLWICQFPFGPQTTVLKQKAYCHDIWTPSM